MPEKSGKTIGWLAVLVAGAALCLWAFPRAFPFFPDDWRIDREAAREIALERLGSLGELPQDPFVVARMDDDAALEYRLLQALQSADAASARTSDLRHRVLAWEITVYPPGASPRDWTHQARLAFDGQVLSLRRGFKAEAAGQAISEEEALRRADRLLDEQGIERAHLEPPTVRRKDLEKRTDLVVRYSDRVKPLGDRLRTGIDVHFAGDELAGFSLFNEDPNAEQVTALLQPITLYSQFAFFSIFLVLPLVAPFFLKRYHEGEIGVQRGLQIAALSLGASVLLMALVAAGSTQGQFWGALSRQQVAWIWGGQMIVIFFLPMSIASFLSWSVGESLCRERWGRKLAAFDALFQRAFDNRTVAFSALRGYAAGFALAGLTFLALLPLARWGTYAPISFQFGPFWNHSRYPALALVLFLLVFSLYMTLFGRLFLLPLLVRRLGRVIGGAIAALATSFVFFAPVITLPLGSGIPIWILSSAALVVLFFATDLLTTLIASFTSAAVVSLYPFVHAVSPGVQLQGWLGLLAGAVPLLLSARHLLSTKTFLYRYEDVPPHVRRIAERERQRVELETARNIQSSILPQLPAQLSGVELAHTYLPATEVGGDFYDVLALEDGRLAVAVGDVAGHGVSSGLVMSMAKSALAVQVTFDPTVVAVFRTLNRMVFQSARKRLLATLCYAVVDPRRREMHFASAGHLFPYRVSRDGKVEVLESVAYPLGVRETIEIDPHVARLQAGDLIFLCSDGVVEARREHSDESFGFERLEKVLSELAGYGAVFVRDRVLAALESFTGGAEREDDLTVLVLKIP